MSKAAWIKVIEDDEADETLKKAFDRGSNLIRGQKLRHVFRNFLPGLFSSNTKSLIS